MHITFGGLQQCSTEIFNKETELLTAALRQASCYRHTAALATKIRSFKFARKFIKAIYIHCTVVSILHSAFHAVPCAVACMLFFIFLPLKNKKGKNKNVLANELTFGHDINHIFSEPNILKAIFRWFN